MEKEYYGPCADYLYMPLHVLYLYKLARVPQGPIYWHVNGVQRDPLSAQGAHRVVNRLSRCVGEG